jgi:AcrR family transcriptional regulator
MKKQPQITDKTRQAFVDAFCELYSHKAIEKISVQEISNKSGYNRSTFYQYFCDIYELLAYVENDVLDYIQQRLNEGRQTVQDVIALYEEKGTYLNALLGSYGSNRFAERLKASFPLNLRQLDLHENDLIAPYLVEFHLSTTFSIFSLWQRRGKDLAPKELLDLILRLHKNGESAFIDGEKYPNHK